MFIRNSLSRRDSGGVFEFEFNAVRSKDADRLVLREPDSVGDLSAL
jgi:hypothetical protein